MKWFLTLNYSLMRVNGKMLCWGIGRIRQQSMIGKKLIFKTIKVLKNKLSYMKVQFQGLIESLYMRLVFRHQKSIKEGKVNCTMIKGQGLMTS